MTSRQFLLLGLAITGVSHSQPTATVALVSDYEFRGVSLSEGNPALQAGLDHAFDSGFALGAWTSNLDYGAGYDGNFELDFYATWSRAVTESLAWGAGLTAYTYPDSEGRAASATQPELLEIEDYVEGYVDVTFGGLRAAQWYTHDYSGLGLGAQYSEIDFTRGIGGAIEWTAHVGYSWGEYWNDASQGGGELLDYALVARWTCGHFTFAGKLTGTDAGDRRISGGAFRNDSRLVFSVETTLPWNSDD
jgi:uncharacterized protein (TIGR02001 family)